MSDPRPASSPDLDPRTAKCTAQAHRAGAPAEPQIERSDAIIRREAELSAVLSNLPLLQLVLRPDGTLVRATERTWQVLGHAATDALGRPLWTLAWWPTPAIRAQVEDAVRRAAHSGQPVQWRCQIATSDGRFRAGEFTARPIGGSLGGTRLLQVSARDVTEEETMRAALAQGERRYRLLLANLPGIVFRADASAPWRIHYVSEGVRRLTGYPVEHFVRDGHPFGSIIVPEDRERLARTLAAQSAAGEPLRCEYRICHLDGSVRWVEGQARPAEDDPNLFEGTVFDIDDRKRAENALEESRAHFGYIAQNSPSVLWTARPDGNIEFISDAYIPQFNRPEAELLERGWQSLLHPDDVARVQARWQHSLQTGEPYEIRFRLCDADGCFRTFQASGTCRRDSTGAITRWYGVLTNVDELVRTQEQLGQSEALARATLQMCPGIVWRALPDGQLDFVSDGCTAQLGWRPAQIMARQWSALLHPDEIEAVSLRYQHALDTGQDFASRHRFRGADGGFQWFQVHATAQRDGDGRILRWYGLATCIEELLQARIQAETAARAKTAFLSTMSHEIRTPLNAVLGFAGLLTEADLGTAERDCVNAIQTSGQHLLGVINDILDFSKLESGHVVLDHAPCELRGLVESALELVASQAATKRLDLCSTFEDGLPAAAMIDAARLRQVLANLLSNAVKFTERGDIELTAGARPLGAEEVELHFSVRDSGCGIIEQALPRLFHDFSQGDDSVARRFGGTGLGLAISRRLVEAHGGTIEVQSRPGHGSTFCVRIPALPCKPSEHEESSPPAALQGRRVIVVDDHRPTLQAIGRTLRAWGVEASLLTDPHLVALTCERARAQGQSFDLALVDQRLGDLDGLTVARELRACAGPPVVLLCEWGSSLAAQQAGIDGVVGTQTKPLRRAALLQMLQQALSSPIEGPARRMAVTPDIAAPLATMRVLLVEDNPVNRKLALLLLRKLGISEPDVALDGLEAVDATARRAYDVVLMDIQMPRLDGLSATRQIRASQHPGRQPDIIAMTANAMSEDRAACVRAGMDGYLAKPIEPAQLKAALIRVAERRGLNGRPVGDASRLPHRGA